MGKYKDLWELIKLIGGVILFFMGAYYLINSHYDNKEKEIENKITAVCRVILYEQPKNQQLYEDCWNTGMEQFSID